MGAGAQQTIDSGGQGVEGVAAGFGDVFEDTGRPGPEPPRVHQLGVHVHAQIRGAEDGVREPVAYGLAVDKDDVLQERIRRRMLHQVARQFAAELLEVSAGVKGGARNFLRHEKNGVCLRFTRLNHYCNPRCVPIPEYYQKLQLYMINCVVPESARDVCLVRAPLMSALAN